MFHCTVSYWNDNNQINKTFSYSEQWRYKGSKKLRQPLVIGRCQPERVISNNKRIVKINFDYPGKDKGAGYNCMYSAPLCIITQGMIHQPVS